MNKTNAVTVKNATPGMVDAAGSMIDNAAAQAHGAVEYAAGAAGVAIDRAKPALDRATDMAHSAVETAADAAATPAKWLARKGEDLQVAQQKLVGTTGNYIVANPVKSLAIALAAGIVLARLVF
jgi:ElaB/YqjD/DUF883 family membrane-anchored ribosome-binding protein